MSDLTSKTYVCAPCKDDRHYLCRPEFACPCPHARGMVSAPRAAVDSGLSTPPAAANRPGAPLGDVAAAGGAVGHGEVPTASPRPGPDVPVASGSGAPFPRPDWWGEHGCRKADDPSHTCLDVDGRPPEHGRPCATECRAAMADLFASYRVPGPIVHGAESVAARLYERLAPMDRAVGQ